MPFKQFDRTRLKLRPLSERLHDFSVADMLNAESPSDIDIPNLLIERIQDAKSKNAAVILMFGAHLIKTGCAPILIQLMEQGFVTHLATNGAGSIHDFELALIGATSESVARYISEGQFGLWRETGEIHTALKEGFPMNCGYGEAVGRYIENNSFPHREKSVFAAAYRMGIPITVHVGIGSDIIHEFPQCDGAVLGEMSYRDFLIFAESVTNLENGVFLNVGSAVAGPEVYLKCLAMARNVAHQDGKKISDFTTAVFDLLPLKGENFCETPPKTDPRYFFRPWKTILARTVADGGQSFYIQGEHTKTLPALLRLLNSKTAN